MTSPFVMLQAAVPPLLFIFPPTLEFPFLGRWQGLSPRICGGEEAGHPLLKVLTFHTSCLHPIGKEIPDREPAPPPPSLLAHFRPCWKTFSLL